MIRPADFGIGLETLRAEVEAIGAVRLADRHDARAAVVGRLLVNGSARLSASWIRGLEAGLRQRRELDDAALFTTALMAVQGWSASEAPKGGAFVGPVVPPALSAPLFMDPSGAMPGSGAGSDGGDGGAAGGDRQRPEPPASATGTAHDWIAWARELGRWRACQERRAIVLGRATMGPAASFAPRRALAFADFVRAKVSTLVGQEKHDALLLWAPAALTRDYGRVDIIDGVIR